MNRYSPWRYLLILAVASIGAVYALPNVYGSDPALQVSAARGADISELTRFSIEDALEQAGLQSGSIELREESLLLRFDSEETQLRAQTVIAEALGQAYTVAVNLAPATPGWLRFLNARPMYLGLDLRGGVHFLMEVDMPAAIATAEERYISDIKSQLREEKIRYRAISRRRGGGVLIRFRDGEHLRAGIDEIKDLFTELDLDEADDEAGEHRLLVTLKQAALTEIQSLALQQNITTLRKRVNELGVAEPVIQQQGPSRVVVQLPGVQDTARAKEILGATATLEFRMTDQGHDPRDAVDGRAPVGSKLYYDRAGEPVLLKKELMLTGDYIINAASGFDSRSGSPNVSITLDGKGARRFADATIDEVGRNMAVVDIENNIEEVINVAEILEPLGKNFQITGLDSPEEARDLALLLRAGALAAPIRIIEERTVGPSLGQDNIDKGKLSVQIGFALVLVFMLVWYKVFGLAANVALTLNLVLIVALLSLLQATLTLPGIAGIVLTVGMAVDANVLIFQRIKEELRNGNSPHSSIHAGYEKAFSTIADANITTLIAALVLFSLGTGPVKGFAVTLSLGIVCSMFTAIVVTRGIVNLIYGGRKLNKLMI